MPKICGYASSEFSRLCKLPRFSRMVNHTPPPKQLNWLHIVFFVKNHRHFTCWARGAWSDVRYEYVVQDNCMQGSKNQYRVHQTTHAALYLNTVWGRKKINSILLESMNMERINLSEHEKDERTNNALLHEEKTIYVDDEIKFCHISLLRGILSIGILSLTKNLSRKSSSFFFIEWMIERTISEL